MAISKYVQDLEKQKFIESSTAGKPAVLVKLDNTGSVGASSSIGDGRKTVAAGGTAEALAASTACSSVNITAETDNTGTVVVGGSTVVAALATRRGTPLSAGESVSIGIDNLSKVYIDTTVNGDGVTYTYTT